MKKQNVIFKVLKHIVVFLIALLYLRYIFGLILVWGFVEIIIKSIKTRTWIRIKDFICNFIGNVFTCIDILSNIVFQVPANRILLINPKLHKFGDPNTPFTKILRLNFVLANVKPRGIALYNIIQFFKNLLK
jgi:hypothetical protein